METECNWNNPKKLMLWDRSFVYTVNKDASEVMHNSISVYKPSKCKIGYKYTHQSYGIGQYNKSSEA